MTCEEAAEFVSALCDGETISRAAAEHIGSCEICGARLRDYATMGVELRREASLASREEQTPPAWERRQSVLQILGRKGWETMRIPKLAFALLLVGAVVLASGLTLAGVRAHTQDTALMLRVASGADQASPCALSFEDKKYADCDWSSVVNRGALNYKIRLLSKDGERVQLGVQTKFAPGGNATNTVAAMKSGPERQFWFEPGKTLRIDVDGYGPITVSGEWLDHIPYFGGIDLEHNLQPEANQLRIVSPMLLKGDRVVSDWKGSSVTSAENPDWAVYFYVPKDGVYVLSQSSMEDAVQGQVEENRVSFEINGQPYQLVTAAPMIRGEVMWVRHFADVPSSWSDAGHGAFGTQKLDDLLSTIEARK